jgi:hypothetical protein
MTVKIVGLSEVRIDGGTQFRDQINQDLVKLYAEKMQEGAIFPPIKATFDGTNYWLYDGFHRYFSIHDLGQKEISVDYVLGDREDAQDLALSANDDHGLQRNNATKRKCVESALGMERHANKSNRDIAKLCKVSDTFVASIRNPEAKKKQAEKVERHYKKKLQEQTEECGSTAPDFNLTEPKPSLHDGNEPSPEELEALEKAAQADLEAMQKLLDADDALKAAHEEIKRLNLAYSQLDVRFKGLMNEKDEAVTLLKKAQKELDKLKAKK